MLKETLPFVAVSICAGIILTLASKFGNSVAADMGLHHGVGKVLVADAFYFAANCLTFALRFLIFHFVLFRDRSAGEALAVVEGREPLLAEPPAAGAMGSARVNGATAGPNGTGNGTAGRIPSRDADLDARIAPDPGSRR